MSNEGEANAVDDNSHRMSRKEESRSITKTLEKSNNEEALSLEEKRALESGGAAVEVSRPAAAIKPAAPLTYGDASSAIVDLQKHTQPATLAADAQHQDSKKIVLEPRLSDSGTPSEAVPEATTFEANNVQLHSSVSQSVTAEAHYNHRLLVEQAPAPHLDLTSDATEGSVPSYLADNQGVFQSSQQAQLVRAPTPENSSLPTLSHRLSQLDQQKSIPPQVQMTRQTTSSNGSTSYANISTPVNPQHLFHQQQAPLPPPPPPPPHPSQQYHQEGSGYPPLCTSPAHTSAQIQSGQQVIKKKGRFTFVEASPNLVDSGKKFHTSTIVSESGTSLNTKEVRKGRFVLTKQLSGEASTTTSQGSHTPAGTPENTPGPPTVQKKGRFVITNVRQVVAGSVPAASQQVPSDFEQQYEAQMQGAASVYENFSNASIQIDSTAQQGVNLQLDQQAAPMGHDVLIRHQAAQYEQSQIQLQTGSVAPSPPPPPPPPPADTVTSAQPSMMIPIAPSPLPSQLGQSLDHEEKTLLDHDVSPEQKAQQTRKVIPRSAIPRNSAVGFAGREGLGKVFYFLDQMRLEVSDAERLIKTLQTDNKCLKDRNKELESLLRESERKQKDEKVIRENCEAKLKALKKKLRAKGELERETHITQQNETRTEEVSMVNEGAERTPMKATVAKNAPKKLSPENKVGGTPPRDPNYSSSPIPNRVNGPSPTISVQKVPIMNNPNPRNHDLSPFAPLQGSPKTSPEKGNLQQSQVRTIPDGNSQVLSATYGSISPRSLQHEHLNGSSHVHNQKGWSYQGAHDDANIPAMEPMMRQVSSTNSDTVSAAARSLPSEFDPLRQDVPAALLETIDGHGSIQRPLIRTESGFFDPSASCVNDPSGDYNSVHDLHQPALTESDQAELDANLSLFAGQQLDYRYADEFHHYSLDAPPQESLQQHDRAMSWDALPQRGLLSNQSGSLHGHSNSHESLFAPSKLSMSTSQSLLPTTDPFEKLMSNISSDSNDCER